ncbi:MAG: hypothetical protein C4520_08475 [Candidatus Abyssobacteria bacterium SURF_5]|uniref:L-2-amino-thiazoline-4-carboxylic acid hydrolase n=1 Tax=Abyssobacteria bacterium (strain SURF_5) TaxID=2093360 RepID=A0A3A4P2M3_ABYX5|nr:MAG: hypothetical protein C4520_08475 [Candidatus Abyssubacteria bacterium SURF_5]
MAGKEGGIHLDEIMAYAKESQEIGARHKVPGDQHVMHLFGSIAREAEAEFGAAGLAMVERAAARFGEERGRRIAELVKRDKRPLSLMNFFLYADFDTGGNEMVPEFVDGELWVRVTKCRLFDKLHELGLQRFGLHYCRPIDRAVLRGYNPHLELEVKTQISGGDDCCFFIYRQPSGSVKED